MQTSTFSTLEFSRILEDSLIEIGAHMKKHPGILHVIQSRFKFEKWFQIELLGRLIEKASTYSKITWHNEISVSSKSSKKGKTIDIGVKKNGEKYIGIELKIIPTSYLVDGFEKKTKAMPAGIKGLINDKKKCCDDGYSYQYSIGLVFPFPLDTAHRNYTDFARQVQRLMQHGNLISLDCNLSEKYVAKYYLLTNYHSK